MHMHFWWGHKKAAVKKLPYLPRQYPIPYYGTFRFDALTEQISFEPARNVMEKVKQKVDALTQKKPSAIILKDRDHACTPVFDYLTKQDAFVTKDWSAHADALLQKLKDFAATRYTFQHTEQYLLVKDTVQSTLYVINLHDDKQPTMHAIPSVILSSCHLIDGGCEYDIQPEQDEPKE